VVRLSNGQLRSGRGGYAVNLRRKTRRPPTEVVVELDNLDELFTACSPARTASIAVWTNWWSGF
jgi:hypothetical protein